MVCRGSCEQVVGPGAVCSKVNAEVRLHKTPLYGQDFTTATGHVVRLCNSHGGRFGPGQNSASKKAQQFKDNLKKDPEAHLNWLKESVQAGIEVCALPVPQAVMC